MADTPSMGHATGIKIGTQQYDFLSCTVAKQGALIQSEGIRSTRSRLAQAITQGPYSVGGQIAMEPRPDELAILLPYILGAGGALAEAVSDFTLTVNKVAGCYDYTGCKVNRATFRSAAGQNLQLILDILGKAEASQTWSAGTLSVQQPYVHHQGVLTLNSVGYPFSRAEVVIDNGLIADRFNNSQTRTAIPEGDRIVLLGCDMPFTPDTKVIYDPAAGGWAGSLVYTNGAFSITFSFANLQGPANPVEIRGRNIELMLPQTLQAYKTGATAEVVVTNDSTP